MKRLLRLSRVSCIAGCALLVVNNCSFVAFGAEWSIAPAFQTRGQFNDNLTLTTQPQSSVWAAWLNPSVRLTYATEIFDIQTTPEFEYVQYFGDDNNDETFTNFFLPFSGTYLTETDRFGLSGAVNRDNALISELEETGIVTDFIQRNVRSAWGNWDHFVTERFTLETSYQFNDVSYENEQRARLIDFQTHTGTVGPSYELTEESRVHGTILYSNSHFSDIGFRAQSAGLEIGIAQRFFESFTITSSGGGRYVETTSQGNAGRQKDTSLVWLFAVSLTREWERSRATVGYSRALNPSGVGVLLETDRVNVGLTHEVGETLKATLSGALTLNDTVGSSAGGRRVSNARFWQVSPGLSWRWTEYLLLDLSYRHAQVERGSSSGGTATANSVNVAITYTWPKWSASK